MFKKEYTVSKFIEEYKKNATDSLKERFIKNNLETIKYVPFAIKDNEAYKIVVSTSFITNKETNNKVMQINSRMRYLLFVCSAINMYTNINIDIKNCVEEYDALHSEPLLMETILSNISEEDLKEYKMILGMCEDDVNTNQLNITSRVLGEFRNLTDTGLNTLQSILTQIKDMDKKDMELIGKNIKKILQVATSKFDLKS